MLTICRKLALNHLGEKDIVHQKTCLFEVYKLLGEIRNVSSH